MHFHFESFDLKTFSYLQLIVLFYTRNLAPALVCCLMINPECQNCSFETDTLAQCLWQVKEITHDTTGKGLTLRVGAWLLAQKTHGTCKTALQLQPLPTFSARPA